MKTVSAYLWDVDIWYEVLFVTVLRLVPSESWKRLESGGCAGLFLLLLPHKLDWKFTEFFRHLRILTKPTLVQKPTIPHMKALILSYLEPEGWGCGIIMREPRPPPVKLFATFLSEVVEAKRVDFFEKKNLIRSNVRISWMHRYRFYDLKVHFWWPNKRLFSYNQRWNTLYTNNFF